MQNTKQTLKIAGLLLCLLTPTLLVLGRYVAILVIYYFILSNPYKAYYEFEKRSSLKMG